MLQVVIAPEDRDGDDRTFEKAGNAHCRISWVVRMQDDWLMIRMNRRDEKKEGGEGRSRERTKDRKRGMRKDGRICF